MKQRYVKINNEQVFLTQPQQKAYDQMINSVRHRARREGSCGQSDYHKCRGDCGMCPWYMQGNVFSTDVPIQTDSGSFIDRDIEDTSISVERDTINRLFFEQLYQLASTIVPEGDTILRLHLEEGLKPYTIAKRMNAKSHATIHGRLEKLLEYIRDHREELLG